MATRIIGLAIALVLLVAIAALSLSGGGERAPVRATITLADALGSADTAGYLRAIEPRSFRFPEDHGPHPGYRTEWWYFTGNVETAGGRRLGYQLTFFRNALRPGTTGEDGLVDVERSGVGSVGARGGGTDASERASAWATDALYMAHFALADIDAGEFHANERFARAAIGLAGAETQPSFRVWTESWAVTGPSDARSIATGGPGGAAVTGGESAGASAVPSIFPLRLHAEQDGIAIDLDLERGKLPVLQGDDGLSRKGPQTGNASYYYSLTRMPTRGSIRIGADTLVVSGTSWMDREWSTSVLPEDVEGWDWFALQLSDSSELMIYRLRAPDGSGSPFSAGSLVPPANGVGAVAQVGRPTRLAAGDFTIEVLDTWTSRLDGTRYPARWRITVPALGLDLEVVPTLADQELDLSVRYWEGSVTARGTRAGRPLTGRGYVELTGYAEDAG